MASAAEEEILAPIAYAITFLVTIMLTKAAIAYAIHRASGNISATVYRKLLTICGIVMIGFSLYYAMQAYELLQEIGIL